ncbi:MAG: DNA-3-methyladenine glycosylase [Candidatus Kaelpia imicola]|nr:DNA-3-methyladenine glycosylase [Candidatus Kaelpia imicola]
MRRFKKSFFLRSADRVAKDILGSCLIRNFSSEERAIVKIVEVEAYMGVKDKGSHSYRGRVTERNKVMYMEGGLFYVYKIYGIYHCLNVVVNKRDIPQAVFIRAVEPLDGIEFLRKNRGFKESNSKNIKNLTDGPGKLTQALKIGLNFNASNVHAKELYISEDSRSKKGQIVATKRLNIDYAEECKDLPLRFYLKGSRFISAK